MEQLGDPNPDQGERSVAIQGRMRIQAGPGSIDISGNQTIMAVLVIFILFAIGYQTYSQQMSMRTIIEQHSDINSSMRAMALAQFMTEDDKKHLNVQGQINDIIKQQAEEIVKKETHK